MERSIHIVQRKGTKEVENQGLVCGKINRKRVRGGEAELPGAGTRGGLESRLRTQEQTRPTAGQAAETDRQGGRGVFKEKP